MFVQVGLDGALDKAPQGTRWSTRWGVHCAPRHRHLQRVVCDFRKRPFISRDCADQRRRRVPVSTRRTITAGNHRHRVKQAHEETRKETRNKTDNKADKQLQRQTNQHTNKQTNKHTMAAAVVSPPCEGPSRAGSSQEGSCCTGESAFQVQMWAEPQSRRRCGMERAQSRCRCGME